MARGFEVSTLIERPAKAVWATMTDFSNAPRWMPGVNAVRPSDGAPLGAGKRFVVDLGTKGRGRERDMTLSAWDPKKAFALSSSEGGIAAVYTYSLEAEGQNIRVTLNGECEATGFLWRLFHPLIVRMMAKHDRRQLELLKRLLESA